MTQPLERKVTAVVSAFTTQPEGVPPNPQLVQDLEWNLAMLMPTLARYLMNIGVPESDWPRELWLDVKVEGQTPSHQIIHQTVDPRTIHHPKVWPLTALEQIARQRMEGEELPNGELFDETGNDMQAHYYECIKLARQSLGWKE